MTDTQLLVCTPLSVTDDPGCPAQIVACHFCKAEVWCSDTMMPVVAVNEVWPVCFECVQGVMKTDDNPSFSIHPRLRAKLTEDGESVEHIDRVLAATNKALRKDRG